MNPITESGLSHEIFIDWLRLIRTPRVGSVTFLKLLARFGTARAALEALPSLSRRGGQPLVPFSVMQAEDEIARCAALDIHCVSLESPYYPTLLKTISAPPPIIFVRGHLSLCTKVAVAVVGTRNASILGKKHAANFAESFGQAGFLVVSGMAHGIDTVAHTHALSHGTLAVLAGGVDYVYPKENQGLYEQLLSLGVIVSEEPVGTHPTPLHFPRRNRIISGIARGVLVVEAALQSGSLITARYALEQGREVFAIPGNPLDTRANGCNKLIKDGAALVENPHEVITLLKAWRLPPVSEPPSLFHWEANSFDSHRIDSAISIIMPLLSHTPIALDDLVAALSDIPPSLIYAALLEMELSGFSYSPTLGHVCLLPLD